MKKSIFHFLFLIFCGTPLFSQFTRTTDDPTLWRRSFQIPCSPNPLPPAYFPTDNFVATPTIVCNAIPSPTGNSKLGLQSPNACIRPDHDDFVFRTSLNLNQEIQPCLATYNFSADNAFRIYVNGISSNTNILPGGTGDVCGNNFSGNDFTIAFSGQLNLANFNPGTNYIYFETQNGSAPGDHPYWLTGSLALWQLTDLNASLSTAFNYDAAANQVNLKLTVDPQATAPLFRVTVEYSNTYPNNPVWQPHYTRTDTKRFITLYTIPPVTNINCDGDGAAVKVTFEAMAGDCSVTSTYIWSCEQHFSGAPAVTKIVKTNSAGDSHGFSLTPEQIMEIHKDLTESMANSSALNTWADSVMVASAGQSTLQVFPNPAQDHIWIMTTADQDELTPVKIFNQMGEVVFDGQIPNRHELDVSTFPQGIYYLKTFSSEERNSGSTKFILQR